ncbi:MAG TPA: class I SAM-dependent methyltransferase [Vicinamibacteria bacterium]|nr:class I SAM-dependent methyltransferase [Vicinamibacteria bacterium]
MNEDLLLGDAPDLPEWPGWCCSYCAAPLRPSGHGLACAREGRWFATLGGIHRLLDDQRRRELQPAVEAARRAQRDERWTAGRARHFARALDLSAARLGPGPWRVLDAGAGCGWAAVRLLELGHAVVAVDIDVDEGSGLGAAAMFGGDPPRLRRAEADIESLPLEPAGMDLVLAAGVLHQAPRPARTLLELRRVTRRGGILVVIDTPVYRRAAVGERAAAERAEAGRRRYGFDPPELGRGYLVRSELSGLFEGAGWRLEVFGWPGPLRQGASELVDAARHGRPGPRFPVLIGRRDG